MIELNEHNTLQEYAVCINRDAYNMAGILHIPYRHSQIGVVVIVGGGQYRVGAHRQFVDIARTLAKENVTVLRFDLFGMGDTFGQRKHYFNNEGDIEQAVNYLRAYMPELVHVGIFGICDGASAGIAYANKSSVINHVMAVNPWIRSDLGSSRAILKHYYISKIYDWRFYKRLFKGRVSLTKAIHGLISNVRKALITVKSNSIGKTVEKKEYISAVDDSTPLMTSLLQFSGNTNILLSKRDLTAKEFYETFRCQCRHEQKNIDKIKLIEVDADHTFSGENEHDLLLEQTVAWVKSIK